MGGRASDWCAAPRARTPPSPPHTVLIFLILQRLSDRVPSVTITGYTSYQLVLSLGHAPHDGTVSTCGCAWSCAWCVDVTPRSTRAAAASLPHSRRCAWELRWSPRGARGARFALEHVVHLERIVRLLAVRLHDAEPDAP